MTLVEATPAAWVLAVSGLMAASFVHGVLGMGFPRIATPLLAWLFGFRSAVYISAPTVLALAMILAFGSGSERWVTLRRLWYLPVFALVGGLGGGLLLAHASPFTLMRLLMGMIGVFLVSDLLRPQSKRLPPPPRLVIPAGATASALCGAFDVAVTVGVPFLRVFLHWARPRVGETVQVLNYWDNAV